MFRLLTAILVVAACTGPSSATATTGVTAAPTSAPTVTLPYPPAPTLPNGNGQPDEPTPTLDTPETPHSTGPVTAPPNQETTPPEPPSAPPEVQIIIGTDPSGAYLVTPDGYSLYTFDEDLPDESTCDGDCAENWPPFSTGGIVVGGAEGVAGTFGFFKRDDLSEQVTYDGAPLYLYAGDNIPGDTKGDGLGGAWRLAAP